MLNTPSTPPATPPSNPSKALDRRQTREAIVNFCTGKKRSQNELDTFLASLNTRWAGQEMQALVSSKTLKGHVATQRNADGTISTSVSYYIGEVN